MAENTNFSYLPSLIFESFPQYFIITICTLVMFVMQRRRASRIFRYYRESIVVFTRYPSAGRTKTRLIPTLGENGAARAQLLMTDHIIDRLLEYQAEQKDVNVHVEYSDCREKDMCRWLDRRSDNALGSLTWSAQRGSHLGSRMKNALMKQFAEGEDRAVLIGSDIPGVKAPVLREALEQLRREDHLDMVLGRATDGGYYLVGLNTNAIPKMDTLFEGIVWSSSEVFDQQKKKAKELGLRLYVLDEELTDVDTAKELSVLTRDLEIRLEDLLYPRWSIVIPVLNEVSNIDSVISNISKSCSESSKVEVIIVDGGSEDGTRTRVKDIAASSPLKITLVESSKGRGTQLRAGADQANGFFLLFLHADTTLPPNFDAKAEQLLSIPGNSGGAFKFALDVISDPNIRKNYSKFFLRQMACLEWLADKRCRKFELPYGDQGLFMTRKTYEAVEGFADWSLLEDYNMVEKLRLRGHVDLVEGQPATTSARRWQKHGFFKITGLNQLIILGYKMGVKPATLARWYYGKPKTD